MTGPENLSDEAFRTLVERAGLSPTAEEMSSLKTLYEHFAEGLASLHDMDLDDEDLAVMYPAAWAPTRPPEEEVQ